MTQFYHTPIPLGSPANAATFNGPLATLDSAVFNYSSGVFQFGNLTFEIGQTLTVGGGAITILKSVHGLNAGGATVDLNTINGGSDGDILFLYSAFAGRTVVLKHGTGNIFLNGGNDISLDTENKTIMLFKHNGIWSDLAFGTTPASGTLVPRTALGADGAISITLPSSTFTHLEVYLELRSDYAGAKYDGFRVQFNGDTTAANYENDTYYINNAGVTAAFYTGTQAGLRYDRAAASSTSPANYYASHVLEVFNYRLASVYRMAYLDGATPADNTGADAYVNLGGGQWKNVAASITSITVIPQNGANWKAGSAYMVKGY